MARYLIQAAYTAEATAALASKPQDRAEAIRGLAKKLGAELESVDFCLGEYDVVAIYSAPDDITATAIAMRPRRRGTSKPSRRPSCCRRRSSWRRSARPAGRTTRRRAAASRAGGSRRARPPGHPSGRRRHPAENTAKGRAPCPPPVCLSG